jgi:excisionase family DNA binding protein
VTTIAVPNVYTAAQVADLLQISERTVRRHTCEGLMPCHRPGRAVRYTPEDIHIYLQRIRDLGVA